jgi:hypothetical protein
MLDSTMWFGGSKEAHETWGHPPRTRVSPRKGWWFWSVLVGWFTSSMLSLFKLKIFQKHKRVGTDTMGISLFDIHQGNETLQPRVVLPSFGMVTRPFECGLCCFAHSSSAFSPNSNNQQAKVNPAPALQPHRMPQMPWYHHGMTPALSLSSPLYGLCTWLHPSPAISYLQFLLKISLAWLPQISTFPGPSRCSISNSPAFGQITWVGFPTGPEWRTWAQVSLFRNWTQKAQ